jgi:uncharacterized protein (DUF1697 family)
MRVAFLRGINVGGHTVKKGVLCDVFLGLDLTEVATFIASGNVLFEPGATDTDEELEVRLAAALEKQLGWPVPIFVPRRDRRHGRGRQRRRARGGGG